MIEVCEHGSLKRQCMICEQRDEIAHLHCLLAPHDALLAQYHEQLLAADALAAATRAHVYLWHDDDEAMHVKGALAAYEKVRNGK